MTDDTHPTLPDDLLFLRGGGAATRLILERDWNSHPLGPPQSWPDALKVSLSLVLNSPESMILAWGAEDLTFFFNETYFPLLGPRLSWAMGARFDVVWADGWTQAKPIIDEAFDGRSTRYVDLPWKLDTDRGPADTWFTFSYSRVLDVRGEIAGLFILTNETTAHVLARQRVEAEQARQRSLLQQMPGFIAVLEGPDHLYAYVNEAYRTISGDRDFLGRSVRAVFPELADQGFYELLDGVYATGERFEAQGAPIALKGEDEPRFIDLLYEPIHDVDGTVTGIFVGGYDVTEAYRTLAALRDSEADLRHLNTDLERRVTEQALARGRTWQLSPELLGVINAEGYFESSNPSWQTLLGWSEREVATTPFIEFVHPDDLVETRSVWDAAINRGEAALRFENRYRRKDGAWRWLSWVAVPDGGKVYCSARDVTAQKEAEAQLAQAQDALRQAQKMEAVGQLTGGLAHDFNNLLAGISGSLELLQKRVAQGRFAELDRYIEGAQGASRRAAALTQRLLAFSRRQTLDPRAHDVNRLVSGMEDLIRRSIGPDVTLETVGAAGLWPTLVDAPQLENALLNLCLNARDAMPDGGRITIETANKTIDARTAQAYELTAGDFLSICVTDTGAGMSDEVVARAFDPFFTTKPLGQGTGLGLSMIFGFVRQSGGQIRIYTELGHGTTMCLYLPRFVGDAEAAIERPEDAVGVKGDGETILVIDDEPTLRGLMAEVLTEAGYRVLQAGDGPSGLSVLQSSARVDLLITDVGLPGGMNGRQVADAARARRSYLKVLFVTGYAENAAVGNGHLEVGMELLTKPFVMSALTAKVSDMLNDAVP